LVAEKGKSSKQLLFCHNNNPFCSSQHRGEEVMGVRQRRCRWDRGRRDIW
jgi:hypothetical protein